MKQTEVIVITSNMVWLTYDKIDVFKTVKVTGHAGECPKWGQEVLVKYTGRLYNGTVFSSSGNKEPSRVVIGSEQVIKGFDIGIMFMRVGEKAALKINSL